MTILERALRVGESKKFKTFEKNVGRIGAFEAELELESDDELRERYAALRERHLNGEPLDELLYESFALTREASKRALGQRHYDVQLIGGMVLHDGSIAEMKTGEGKTLTATLPIVLNGLAARDEKGHAVRGQGVHLVTVNDYLARRDANWMKPIYDLLGVTVGIIQGGMYDIDKQEAYSRDVVYGTNSEFGFDYLRDNLAETLEGKAQRGHGYAIVDEVDNILIDEARTPLIISGRPEQAADTYYKFAKLARIMEAGKKPEGLEAKSKEWEADYDFEPEEKHKTVSVSEKGVAKAEKFLGIDNLYRAEYGHLVNHLHQALKAESLYKRDVDYAVIDGEVKIIDEFTGRILEGRRWSEGLHQAVEAKEDVAIQEENQTVATITYQNYFRKYDKLAGMTGTALTEATEFMKIYELQVVEVPTNRPMVRRDNNDQIYKTKPGKWTAVADEIEDRNKSGQPVLVGTISVEVSELLSGELNKRGIKHSVLNAKPEHAEREGETIAEAGAPFAVTIATNMAGRGVDIKLGGNEEHLTDLELRKRGLEPGKRGVGQGLGRGVPRARGAGERGPREGQGVGRPVHPRHRAPRVAPDRQPAARPLRAPGRSRRVALLPVGRGRPRAPVRRRPHLPHPRQQVPRPGGRRGQGAADRAQDAHQADRGRPEEGRGPELPAAQARARVRRRDEPAARDRLRVPRPHPRGPGHVGHRAHADRRRDRAPLRGVPGRRLPGGVGARAAARAARRDLRRLLRGRRHPRGREPRVARGEAARRRGRRLQRARGRSWAGS